MLTIALLGQLNVRLDGQPADLTLRPVQMLLAYLLLNRGVAHRRERLAGMAHAYQRCVQMLVMTPKNWTQIVTTLGDPDQSCLLGKPLGFELSRRQISQ